MTTYPNVPDAPGVPPVNRDPNAPTSGDLSGSFSESKGGTPQDRWGIYSDAGRLVLEVDSVVALGFVKDFSIASHPTEQGGFQSYNKVENPYDARLQVVKSGPLAERSAFFDALESLASSLDLYTVVMPEKVYTSANIVHVDFDRAADRGAGMALANIYLQQVRVTATAEFTDTRSENGAAVRDGGAVQARQPTDVEARAGQVEVL